MMMATLLAAALIQPAPHGQAVRTDHFVERGEGRLFVREVLQGTPRSGPSPILLLHGARVPGVASFDLDVCDPAIAPGVGTPVKGGLDYREAHMLMEMIADSGLLRALDLVEVNPILDDRNTTAILGVELAMSALGQQII